MEGARTVDLHQEEPGSGLPAEVPSECGLLFN